MKLSDYSIKHPAVITILLVMISVFGVIAIRNTNQEAFPPMGLPGASVLTVYPGIGSEFMEIEVTRPIEDALSGVSGLKGLSSSSKDSVSVVSVEFRDGEDAYSKLPEIREKLNSVSDTLPEGISGNPEIFIHDAGSFLPIYTLMIKSSLPDEVFSSFIEEDFKSGITRIDGVSNVNIYGGKGRELEIKIHLDELETRGLAVLDIFTMLQYYNISLPAGTVGYLGRNINIRTSGEFTSIDEIENLVIGNKGSSLIYLKDVADIGFTEKQPDSYIRSEGEDAILIDIMKREQGNTIDIINAVDKLINDTNQRFPGKLEFHVVTDQKERTELTINTVIQTALTGIILAILVIYIFLHDFRSTIIIGLSLPISILITFIGMYLTGTTINMLSLSGITVAIGMIVDSSIVVLENTSRHSSEGKTPETAASLGAGEVGGAVLASATTSICVFLPMAFLSGVIGIIMKGLSLSIVFALGSSALVSVIIVPYLSAIFLKKEPKHIRGLSTFHNLIEKALQALTNSYRKLLSKVLRRPAVIILTAIIVLALTVVLVSRLGISFLPPTDTGEIEFDIRTPQFYSLEESRGKADEIDAMCRELVPELATSVFQVNNDGTITGKIRLVKSGERERSVQDIIKILQTTLNNEITDTETIVVNGGFDSLLGMATGGQGFKIRLYGSNLDDIMKEAEKINSFLESDREVIKTQMSMRYGKEEIVSNLMLDYMGNLGITPYEAAITSKIFFSGLEAGTFRFENKNYSMKLTSDIAGQEINEDTISLINIKTASGKPVSMTSLTELERKPAVSVINKQNKTISLTVTAHLNTLDQIEITSRVDDFMKTRELPYGLSWEIGGTSSLVSESFSSLFLILGIAVFLVYSVMVIQFEKFVQPVIIMLSIPFCLIGVVLGLIIFGSIISIIPMLGVISLAGIVVNNGIVLIDYINLIRKRDKLELSEAVITGCTARLKPIMMTTLTTFFGVLPMAFAGGNGSEIYAPLGQAIAGGLITSTCLTLFLIPAVYKIIEEKALSKSPASSPQKQPELHKDG